MMTLAARALKAAGMSQPLSDATGMSQPQSEASVLDGYRDKALVADYALEAVSSLIEANLIVREGGMLHPRDETSIAEAAVFLYRIYQLED